MAKDKEKKDKKKDKEKDSAGSTANNVYIMDKEFAWIPAQLISQSGDKAVVNVPQYKDEGSILSDGGAAAIGWEERTVNLKHYPGKGLPQQNLTKENVLDAKEDMVDLPFLHEVRLRWLGIPGHFQ
jgi:hypothetical protein